MRRANIHSLEARLEDAGRKLVLCLSPAMPPGLNSQAAIAEGLALLFPREKSRKL
jgi:hypothetical protein